MLFYWKMKTQVNAVEAYITYYWNEKTRDLHIFRVEEKLDLAKRKFRRVDLPKFIDKISDLHYKMQLQKVVMTEEQYDELLSFSNRKTDFKEKSPALIKICEKIFQRDGYEVENIYSTIGGVDYGNIVYWYCDLVDLDGDEANGFEEAEFELGEDKLLYNRMMREYIFAKYR